MFQIYETIRRVTQGSTVCVLAVDIFCYTVSKRQPVCWIINPFNNDRGMAGIVMCDIYVYVKLLNGQTAWPHGAGQYIRLFPHH
jgi:hypothetical protein